MKIVIIYCVLIKKKCILFIVVNVVGLLFSFDNVYNNVQYDNELGQLKIQDGCKFGVVFGLVF